jgi:hypothetical protein
MVPKAREDGGPLFLQKVAKQYASKGFRYGQFESKILSPSKNEVNIKLFLSLKVVKDRVPSVPIMKTSMDTYLVFFHAHYLPVQG